MNACRRWRLIRHTRRSGGLGYLSKSAFELAPVCVDAAPYYCRGRFIPPTFPVRGGQKGFASSAVPDGLFDTLRDKLGQFKTRRDELLEELSTNQGLSPEKLASLSRELAEAEEAAAGADLLRAAEAELADLRGLVAAGEEEGDSELAALARGEAEEVAARVATLRGRLLTRLVPGDPDDTLPALVEVRAGTGGQEAALFAQEVLEMYQKFSKLQGWSTNLLQHSTSDLGGCREATLSVGGGGGGGGGAYGALRWESGVHRVQRVPVNDVRVHTSAISVAVLPDAAQETELQIKPSDLRIDVYRASGAGGQHVNTTESAVRVTHLPTGTVVAIQDERSQHQNRAKALRLLGARVRAAERARREAERNAERRGKMGTGDRSGRVRTYNFPQDRVTEHRTGYTAHGTGKVLSGEGLVDIIQSLRDEDTQEKIKALVEESGK